MLLYLFIVYIMIVLFTYLAFCCKLIFTIGSVNNNVINNRISLAPYDRNVSSAKNRQERKVLHQL